MDVNLSEFRELVMDREAWRAAFMGSQRSDTTEQLNWTERNPIYMPTAYSIPIWISEIEASKLQKKESERKIAESKQVVYILEISKLQKTQ